MLKIEVAFATIEEQAIIRIEVPEGTSIEQAIIESNIINEFREINLESMSVGIFSECKTLETIVKHGDRVEIYRELIADPKQMRRDRAEDQKNS
ncbi:MAG: RnfH family protein [Proteobacteria bacterium]|nr:RnfH family protein [Pseudomonadota bacterium]